MKYGVHRLTWGDYFDASDLKSFLKQVRQTGADTVEFRPPDEALHQQKEKINEIRKMAQDENIELLFCYGYPTGVDMRSKDQYAREYAVEHLKRAICAVEALGGKSIGGVLYSNWPTDYVKDYITNSIKQERKNRCIECMQQVDATAKNYGIAVNLEVLNRFEDYIINTVDEGLDFLNKIGSNNFGLTLDVFHLNIEEDDLLQAIRKAEGKIGQFHATEPNRCIPWHNTRFDWPAIGKVLREINYNGSITMEAIMCFDDVSSYNLRQWRNHISDTSLEARIQAMNKGILFLKQQFAQ